MSEKKTLTEVSESVAKSHVILIHEKVTESYARDLGTALTFISLWSVGFFMGSPALEWLGVFAGISITVAKSIKVLRKGEKSKMTPKEARIWLDENFPE